MQNSINKVVHLLRVESAAQTIKRNPLMKKAIQYVYPQRIDDLVQPMRLGTLYDRKLDPQETDLLKDWLHRNEKQLRSSASLPLAELSIRLAGTRNEGDVSPKTNRTSLSKVSEQQLNPSDNFISTRGGAQQKSENIFTDDPSISFEGKCFQFSGTLEFGKRADAVLAADKLGGFTPGGDSLTKLVNYLVVGNLEKAERRRRGYGGKINKAMNLNREADCKIQIIHERDFFAALVRAFRKLEKKIKPFSSAEFTYGSLSNSAAYCV